MSNEEKALSFEQALTQLEEIVNQLERGEVSLDDAVAAYERGRCCASSVRRGSMKHVSRSKR